MKIATTHHIIPHHTTPHHTPNKNYITPANKFVCDSSDKESGIVPYCCIIEKYQVRCIMDERKYFRQKALVLGSTISRCSSVAEQGEATTTAAVEGEIEEGDDDIYRNNK